ncbi:hypothetical protein, partial [Achromobacter spanius]|uniref:hypothetical protein n=1 Tax=Achromobacter spanius TaxID=217203 RepID=UPI00381FD2FF
MHGKFRNVTRHQQYFFWDLMSALEALQYRGKCVGICWQSRSVLLTSTLATPWPEAHRAGQTAKQSGPGASRFVTSERVPGVGERTRKEAERQRHQAKEDRIAALTDEADIAEAELRAAQLREETARTTAEAERREQEAERTAT